MAASTPGATGRLTRLTVGTKRKTDPVDSTFTAASVVDTAAGGVVEAAASTSAGASGAAGVEAAARVAVVVHWSVPAALLTMRWFWNLNFL